MNTVHEVFKNKKIKKEKKNFVAYDLKYEKIFGIQIVSRGCVYTLEMLH